MKQYIINVPNLQSLPKRLSSFAVGVLCWVMWGYLVYPIIVAINWVSGDFSVINEMRWFGGYKSLLDLLEIYVGTLAMIGIGWLCWIILRKLRRQRTLPAAEKVLSDDDISAFYHVKKEKICRFREQQNVTVFFDAEGRITDLN
jgi:poly-beta-1,6-N-acetyl-D-glucosamine biosynthesis protein PgaD